jgi:hypothetical protein
MIKDGLVSEWRIYTDLEDVKGRLRQQEQ